MEVPPRASAVMPCRFRKPIAGGFRATKATFDGPCTAMASPPLLIYPIVPEQPPVDKPEQAARRLL